MHYVLIANLIYILLAAALFKILDAFDLHKINFSFKFVQFLTFNTVKNMKFLPPGIYSISYVDNFFCFQF